MLQKVKVAQTILLTVRFPRFASFLIFGQECVMPARAFCAWSWKIMEKYMIFHDHAQNARAGMTHFCPRIQKNAKRGNLTVSSIVWATFTFSCDFKNVHFVWALKMLRSVQTALNARGFQVEKDSAKSKDSRTQLWYRGWSKDQPLY